MTQEPGKANATAQEAQLDELLREGIAASIQRERTSFDKMTGPLSKSLVLFGAGNLGRKTLAGLRQAGIEPLAFADNNPALWNQRVNGLTVLSPQDAVRRYAGQAAFVITIWSGQAKDRMADRERQLRELGCPSVVSFGPLFWKYAQVFLPHYAADLAHKAHEQAEDVRAAFGLWADDASRQEYLAQVRWRLLFDFDGLADPVRHPIYFPSDLCRLSDRECFVDCGAFDGDTIQSFLSQARSSFAGIFAFEPDPVNFAKLRESVSRLPAEIRAKIVVEQAATGAEKGRVRFSATGAEDASVGTGEAEVECVSLDEALGGAAPTYLKMDIEGAELDTLAGARHVIECHAPVIAACSYHRQDHLWRIPLMIHEFNPGYRFFLRPHLVEVWDLVCYAIPANRLTLAS